MPTLQKSIFKIDTVKVKGYKSRFSLKKASPRFTTIKPWKIKRTKEKNRQAAREREQITQERVPTCVPACISTESLRPKGRD